MNIAIVCCLSIEIFWRINPIGIQIFRLRDKVIEAVWCQNLGICYQVDPKVPVGRVCSDNTWRDRFPSGRISGIKFAYKRVIYGNTPKFVTELYLDSAKFRVRNNIFIFSFAFICIGHNYGDVAKSN